MAVGAAEPCLFVYLFICLFICLFVCLDGNEGSEKEVGCELKCGLRGGSKKVYEGVLRVY